MMVAAGVQMEMRSVMEPWGDAVEGSYKAVLQAVRTPLPRRAWSKPAERVSDSGHEESKPSK
jgi:hypothetical protein